MSRHPFLNKIAQGLFVVAVLAGSVVSAAETTGKRTLNLSELPKDIQQEVEKRFPQLATGRFTYETLDDVIRFLQSHPSFDMIQALDMGDGKYKIVTQRSTRIAKISFQGLSAVSESDAKSVFGINPNDVLNQEMLITGGEKLRQYYAQLGYRNTVVDLEIPPDQGDVDVIVKMKEGPQTVVRMISVSSPNQDLNHALEKKLSGQKGSPLTDPQLAEIQKRIRDYLNSNDYVRADIQGPEISFSTDESQAMLVYKLDKVETYVPEFIGNRDISTRTLRAALQFGDFYSSNPNIGAELASRLKNLYLSKGYARVEIQSEDLEGRRPFQRRLIFNIEEGPEVKIAKIEFTGNFSRPSKYYADLLRKQSSDLVEKGDYNKEDIDKGLKNLFTELQNQGYLLAKINSSRTQYNKEKNQVSIFVNIDEGALTTVGSINFVGNDTVPPEELLKVLNLQAGEALHLNDLDRAIANLKAYYQNKGYIEMVLLNEKEDLVTYNETNTEAKLTFKITEGPRVKIGSIILDGNTFSKDYVILNDMDLKVGDYVTPAKIEESKARLQRAGHFTAVEIHTLEEKTSVANRTLIVKVTEREPGLFTVGAGVTSDYGVTLRGYTGIGYNNILGTGRGVSLRVEGDYNITNVKYPESNVTLGYLEPYLFNSDYRGRINLTRSSTVTDYTIQPNYKITDLRQTTFTVEKSISSHITAFWDLWSLAQVRDSGFGPTNSLPVQTEDIATTGPRLEVDFRDNPFNPTTGTFTSAGLQYSTPGLGSSSTISFLKSTAGFTKYTRWPMKDRYFVWANSVRGGYLENLDHSNLPNSGVPYDKEGFILGGDSTIRGYNGATEYFPDNCQLGLTTSNCTQILPNTIDTYFLKGFATMYLFKSEIRFPLYGNFDGAVFYDGGAVHIQGLDLQDEYRDSAGFGIHYNTPFGPVVLELAWKLRDNIHNAWEYHFAIGTF